MKTTRAMRAPRAPLSLLLAMAVAACVPSDPEANQGQGPDSSDLQDMEPGADDGPPPQDQGPQLVEGIEVTVATFNVERLFDARCDSGRCGDSDFEEVPSELALQSRLERIQKALGQLDADVIVLQEIETEELFEQLRVPLAQDYPVGVFGETGFDASLDVGVMARGELLEQRGHRDDPIDGPGGDEERFARELLEVHLEQRGERVVVFGAHFISKATRGSEDRRLAEAYATAELAERAVQAHPEALVVVAGDLNDTPGSAPIEALERGGLEVLAGGLDPEAFYTHIYRGERQILDHVLFWDTEQVDAVPGGVEVLRDEGRSGFGGSDHAALRARFRVASQAP